MIVIILLRKTIQWPWECIGRHGRLFEAVTREPGIRIFSAAIIITGNKRKA